MLDPCCGTGAYLVEVVRRIHESMTESGGDALIGDDVKQAALDAFSASKSCQPLSLSPTFNWDCYCKTWDRRSPMTTTSASGST